MPQDRNVYEMPCAGNLVASLFHGLLLAGCDNLLALLCWVV